MNIEIGNKPIDFVFQGDELIYPNYAAKDNLVLHYDFSGRTNLDVKKGIAEDLSGNGNDGILENFAYESGSGYDSNSYLEFDNVDDFITIPELNLDVNNFTVAVDGEVLSYRGDNVAKINENGLEIGGRNLIKGTSDVYKLISSTGTDTTYLDGAYATLLDDGEYTTKIHLKGITGTGIGIRLSLRWYIDAYTNLGRRYSEYIYEDGYVSYTGIKPAEANRLYVSLVSDTAGFEVEYAGLKIEKVTIPTDWHPAPEDFQTTKITPIFSNKIKTLMYWNRALTDTELQEVYNVQKHRI